MDGNYEHFKKAGYSGCKYQSRTVIWFVETLYEYHDKLDRFQLKTLCALVYDLAAEIHGWTEKEEEIVMGLEEEKRNG